MIAFQVQNMTIRFTDRVVLKGVNLSVEDREKIGLIGVNGSGKTTLLKCLTGELMPDEGSVTISSGLTLGCLEQLPPPGAGLTAWGVIMQSYLHLVDMRQQMHDLEVVMGAEDADLDRVMEQYGRISEAYERANGYACENMARRILTGLGFSSDEFSLPLDSFSGGQKTRLNLGRLLALSPDILLLDEPTNHLDLASVEWLEGFVADYPGTVLVVSHDRMFLDRVATRIAELQGGMLRTYAGNYAAYLEKKAQEDLSERRAFEKQQEFIRQTEAYIRRFRAGIKSKQARGRASQLERLERLSAPESARQIKLRRLKQDRESGQDVLNISHVCKAYPGRPVLTDINLQVKKGDKIAIIGPNGCGKTTLLKLIKGLITPDDGEISIGSRVDMAYFSQEHFDLDPANTLLQEIYSSFDLTLEEARTALGGMLFEEDDAFKKVGDLSGGELGRLALLKVILSGANFLLLDEPTNHLDIPSCQVVEQLLHEYDGTVVVVSHDRYFIDRVAERVVELENGEANFYWGNYSYYHQKKLARSKAIAGEAKETPGETRDRPAMQHRQEQKESQRDERRKEQELARLESQINSWETRKRELENWLSEPDNYKNESQARQYSLEYNHIDQQILAAYEHWELLMLSRGRSC
ncbi:MAG: ABC-F family ATP-binding cassette domain-containing protein [Syntrophomonadaceae bacterium]